MFTLALLALAAMPQASATITVDVTHPSGTVNPLILGGNIVDYQAGAYGDASSDSTDRGQGIWDPVQRKPVAEMVARAKGAGMSVARWPGGCATHLYEWKKTVGPLKDRTHQLFGLPEYLTFCQAVGAQPLISVAEYIGTPQDAADLVEYLNAPNDGKHRWAALRAADGHPKPVGVTYFEFGNESEHGPHGGPVGGKLPPAMTPEQYGRRYLEYRHAMRAVDPSIQLGAVLATGFPPLANWAKPVLGVVGKDVDYAIQHTYIPSYGQNDGVLKPDALFTAAWAAPDQIGDYYQEMHRLIKASIGKDLEIAVTEYNGGFVQETPAPYRHCLGNALLIADMLQVYLHPEYKLLMANFWEFENEYWGAVKGFADKGQTVSERPQYWPAALLHQHFGPTLLPCSVSCERYDVSGAEAIGIRPHFGDRRQSEQLTGAERFLGQNFAVSTTAEVGQELTSSLLHATFKGTDVNYYHARLETPAEEGRTYRVSGMIRTENLSSSNGACFQIGDTRGWVATHSAEITPTVSGTKGWTRVSADYTVPAGGKGIEIIARRLSGPGPVSGDAYYKDIRVQQVLPFHYPGVAMVTASASRSADGKRVYVYLVNHRLDGPTQVTLKLGGFSAKTLRAWILSGPSVDATNEKDPKNVRVTATGEIKGHSLSVPAHSVVAIELRG